MFSPAFSPPAYLPSFDELSCVQEKKGPRLGGVEEVMLQEEEEREECV